MDCLQRCELGGRRRTVRAGLKTGAPGLSCPTPHSCLKALVTPIAVRRVGRVLALAPPDGGRLGAFKSHRLQARALVAAIAKWLVRGKTARAPEMHAGLDFERQRLGIADARCFRHAITVEEIPRESQRSLENGDRRLLGLGRLDGLVGLRPRGLRRYRHRALSILRVTLDRHIGQKGGSQPNRQERGGTRYEKSDFHQKGSRCSAWGAGRWLWNARFMR
jgi:hypothetical protein